MCLAHSNIDVLGFFLSTWDNQFMKLIALILIAFFVSPSLPKTLNAGLMSTDFPLLSIFGNGLNYVEICLDFSCVESNWMSFYSFAFELAESVS